MIHCPECGEMISEKANACPKCGRPLKNPHSTELVVLRVLVFVLAFTTILLIVIPNVKKSDNTASADVAELTSNPQEAVDNQEQATVPTIPEVPTIPYAPPVIDDVQITDDETSVMENETGQENVTVPEETAPSEWAGDESLDFSMQTNEGENFVLSQQAGNVVVLNFWATWCGYCVDELPAFQKLYDEYGDDNGVRIMTINCGETSTEAHRFLSQNKYTFPCIYDTDGDLSYQYNVTGIPLTVIFNKDGSVAYWLEGERDYDTFKKAVEEALK